MCCDSNVCHDSNIFRDSNVRTNASRESGVTRSRAPRNFRFRILSNFAVGQASSNQVRVLFVLPLFLDLRVPLNKYHGRQLVV